MQRFSYESSLHTGEKANLILQSSRTHRKTGEKITYPPEVLGKSLVSLTQAYTKKDTERNSTIVTEFLDRGTGVVAGALGVGLEAVSGLNLWNIYPGDLFNQNYNPDYGTITEYSTHFASQSAEVGLALGLIGLGLFAHGVLSDRSSRRLAAELDTILSKIDELDPLNTTPQEK